jgi:hypothetical protein
LRQGCRAAARALCLSGRPVAVVVRIGDMASRDEIAGAIYLSGLLRPRGVPLPTLLAEDIQSEFPWMLLERLPGIDLGAVISRLADEQLDGIAANVVQAQTITANTGSAGRRPVCKLNIEDVVPRAGCKSPNGNRIATSQPRCDSSGKLCIRLSPHCGFLLHGLNNTANCLALKGSGPCRRRRPRPSSQNLTLLPRAKSVSLADAAVYQPSDHPRKHVDRLVPPGIASLPRSPTCRRRQATQRASAQRKYSDLFQ